MELTIADRAARGIDREALERFMERAKKAVGLAGAVSVLLTSNRDMRRLNRRFRGKDRPTDVLSFPVPPVLSGACAGDIAISAPMAVASARTLGHSTTDEIKILALHGLLHLAGYDHETDQGEMRELETTLRRKLGLPGSLIHRSGGGNASLNIGRNASGQRARRAVAAAARRRAP